MSAVMRACIILGAVGAVGFSKHGSHASSGTGRQATFLQGVVHVTEYSRTACVPHPHVLGICRSKKPGWHRSLKFECDGQELGVCWMPFHIDDDSVLLSCDTCGVKEHTDGSECINPKEMK